MNFKSFNNKTLQLEYDKEIVRELARNDTKQYIEFIHKKEKTNKESMKTIGISVLLVVTVVSTCLILQEYL